MITSIETTSQGFILHPAGVRFKFFTGNMTKRVDFNGKNAIDHLWYYEPLDYEGDVLWSIGYATLNDCLDAACNEHSEG